MARHAEPGDPSGETVEANLMRLGYARLDAPRVVRAMSESGEPMSRQRLAVVLKLPRMLPETVEKIARALCVDPAELTRPSPRPKSPPPSRGKGKG